MLIHAPLFSESFLFFHTVDLVMCKTLPIATVGFLCVTRIDILNEDLAAVEHLHSVLTHISICANDRKVALPAIKTCANAF